MNLFKKKRGETEVKRKLGKKEDALHNRGREQEEKTEKEDHKTLKWDRKGRKPKDDSYVLRKNRFMKVFRTLFWMLLLFVFGRGLYQIVKPQEASELRQIITEFKAEQEETGNTPNEIMDFAQDFAKEYLSYEKGGEQDFKSRIAPYVTRRIYNTGKLYTFHSTAKANYVNAYRMENDKKGGDIYNVYIKAEIEYDKGEEGVTYAGCTLKVPVASTQTGYCVAALPVFMQDVRQDNTYSTSQTVSGNEIDSSIIEPSVKNFLEAYYSQDQSMINYLLTQDADKNKFIAIQNRYKLKKIESIKTYQEENTAMITCILTVRIVDPINDEEIGQEYTLTLMQSNDKFYVKDMNIV